MSFDAFSANNQLTENIWEYRDYVDVRIFYVEEGSYVPGYIETVDIDGEYE
jgi:hypothetical protein